MTTIAPRVFKKESVSTLEELNDGEPSLVSNLAQLFGRRKRDRIASRRAFVDFKNRKIVMQIFFREIDHTYHPFL